jgi:hypothetical protein
MGLREPVVYLGRRGAAKTLMRSEKGIVGQAESEPSFELFQSKRFEYPYAGDVFDGSPQTFYQSDGAGFSDGAETLPNVEVFEDALKVLGDELRALVRDEVSRHAETLVGFAEETGDGVSGRFGEKNAGGQRHPGEHIDDGGDLELEDAEKTNWKMRKRPGTSVRSAMKIWLG